MMNDYISVPQGFFENNRKFERGSVEILSEEVNTGSGCYSGEITFRTNNGEILTGYADRAVLNSGTG